MLVHGLTIIVSPAASDPFTRDLCTMDAFTPEQEKWNARTHFAGVAVGLVAAPVLLWSAHNAPHATAADFAGAAVYSFAFILVFALSACYHYFKKPKLKYRFEIFDHVGIYFMIAGTYTPFLLAFAEAADQWWMLIGIWVVAFLGSLFKSIFPDRFRIFSMLIYVVMGWLMVVAPESFKDALPGAQFYWILAGAACYIGGLVFYIWPLFRYHHAVWHLFVLAGAMCHYVGVITMFL
jgi:hemolysin III